MCMDLITNLSESHGYDAILLIVSDQDPKFTNAFSMHFSKEVAMKLRFSKALHSQMNGNTERVNGVLKQYLRNLVEADQGDWADYVGRAECNYNVATHSATKGWSFMAAFGMRSNLLT